MSWAMDFFCLPAWVFISPVVSYTTIKTVHLSNFEVQAYLELS